MTKDKAERRRARIRERLLKALEQSPQGLTRTEIHQVLRYGYTAAEINAVIRELEAEGLIVVGTEERPVTRMFRVQVLKLAAV